MRRILLIKFAAIVGLAACATAPVPSDGRQWNLVTDEGGEAKLAYGTPFSDDVVLMLACARHSGSIDVMAPALKTGPAAVTLRSGRAALRVNAVAEPDELTGGALVATSAPAADAAFARFRRTGALQVAVDGQAVVTPAVPRDQAASFLSHCRG